MSSMSMRMEEYNAEYKPLETVQVRAVEVLDGSGQHARVWGLPAGTLDPRSYDVFSNFCEGSCETQPLPRTIREIMPAAAGDGLGTFQYTEICKRMDASEILEALSGLAGIGLKIDSNMVVKNLLPGCAAEQCGCINLGDILVAIDGQQTRKTSEAVGRLMGRQGSFTTVSFERHEVGPDGAQLKRSFEVELMRGGPDFISLMLRVYALENEAAELRATTISMQRNGEEQFLRDNSDSWTRPSQITIESKPPEQHLLAAQAAELERERARVTALEQELLKAGHDTADLSAKLEQAGKNEEQLRAQIQALDLQAQEAQRLQVMVQGFAQEREARQKEAEGLQYKLQAVTLKMSDMEQRTLPTLQKNNQLLEQKLAEAKKQLEKKQKCWF